jgi:hypothetical protein
MHPLWLRLLKLETTSDTIKLHKDAISDEGFYRTTAQTVPTLKPNNLLDKDMLLVSRLPPLNSGGYVDAGSETNEQLIVWHRQDKILIKINHMQPVADESLPISISVKKQQLRTYFICIFDM